MSTQPHRTPPRSDVRPAARSDAELSPQVATPTGPVFPTPTQHENDSLALAGRMPTPPTYHKWDNSPFEDPTQTPPAPTWP